PEPDVALLDALPILPGINITEAPERIQRKLYDALQLQIHYDRPDHARFRLTLTDDTVNALTQATTGAVHEPDTRAHATATPPGAQIHLAGSSVSTGQGPLPEIGQCRHTSAEPVPGRFQQFSSSGGTRCLCDTQSIPRGPEPHTYGSRRS